MGGADDHGEATDSELVGDVVRGYGGSFAVAVSVMGGIGGALYGCDLALDSLGVGGDGGSGGVGNGGGGGWSGAKHDEVGLATNAACIGGVDG